VDKETFKKIAFLSRLSIDEKDLEPMLNDFNKISEYVDKVKELDTSSVKEDDLYFQPENFLRKDTIEESLTREEISKIAPKYENGYIVVPRVIET
jgi:aspartyl-tRNA(Asn)/glutamyl-tRNA(Gln) amidotransferase subunit C